MKTPLVKIVIVLIIIGFVFTLFSKSGNNTEGNSTPQPTPVTIENWKTYTDPISHYSIKYPPEWSEVMVSSGGIDDNHNTEANNVYITPKDTSANDDGVVISDRQNSVLSWWALPIGSCGKSASDLCSYKKFVSTSGVPFDYYYIQAKGNFDDYGYNNGNVQLNIEFNHNIDTNIKNAVINSFIYPASISATTPIKQ